MMPHALEVLRQEHRQMSRLLDLLERQLDLMATGAAPDTELLTEICDYFRSFPDLYHHPKEELIIRRLLERDAPGASELAVLTGEHEDGSQDLSRLSRALVDMLMEPETRRSAFESTARAFLDSERRHMAWEDGRFFEIAESGLDASDWSEIDAKIGRLKYPAFERAAEARFKAMGNVLERWRTPTVN